MKIDSELWYDINVVASVLKLFLRKLPRCLLTPGIFRLSFLAAEFITASDYCCFVAGIQVTKQVEPLVVGVRNVQACSSLSGERDKFSAATQIC